jgi:hypothetical protein
MSLKVKFDRINEVLVFEASDNLKAVSDYLSDLTFEKQVYKGWKYYKPVFIENQKEQYLEWLEVNNLDIKGAEIYD